MDVDKLGPLDHGLPMTLDEFLAATYEEGAQYELVDGVLYATPTAELPEAMVAHWVLTALHDYEELRPDVINFVFGKARFLVPGRPGPTSLQPDITAYHDFPSHRPIGSLSWDDVSPMLVVEVVCIDDPEKDLIRNVELYLQVPSIQEYWLFDTRSDPNRPRMTARRRRGRRWQPRELGFGDIYTTELLPGFKLIIDPRR